MGSFTPLSHSDAQRIAAAHGLGDVEHVTSIPAGTVNSNYFLDTARGRFFVRLYEQQALDGVRYEWALLDHLQAGGVPLARRVVGPEAGAVQVAGKPVAVFEAVSGASLCQALVTHERARAVGAALARANEVGLRFAVRRAGRFTLDDVARLLRRARAAGRPELEPTLGRLERLERELSAETFAGAPRGVIHGDLFRDNVLWQGDSLVALLDWESASDGVLLYDLAVALLAWCCGDRLDFGLAAAMVAGYQSQRLVSPPEWQTLWSQMRLGCLRFATTRIIDVYLRGGYAATYKPYTRFLDRLDAVERETPQSLLERLAIGASGT